MKKSIKILFVIILIILVFVVLVFVFKKKILFNNKTNFSDLVCTKDLSNSTVDIKEEVKITFKFDNQGIVKSYLEERNYTFFTESEAQEHYGYLLKYSDAELKIESNKIFTWVEYEMVENEGYYGKTKEELKEYYEKEFNFLCE